MVRAAATHGGPEGKAEPGKGVGAGSLQASIARVSGFASTLQTVPGEPRPSSLHVQKARPCEGSPCSAHSLPESDSHLHAGLTRPHSWGHISTTGKGNSKVTAWLATLPKGPSAGAVPPLPCGGHGPFPVPQHFCLQGAVSLA